MKQLILLWEFRAIFSTKKYKEIASFIYLLPAHRLHSQQLLWWLLCTMIESLFVDKCEIAFSFCFCLQGCQLMWIFSCFFSSFIFFFPNMVKMSRPFCNWTRAYVRPSGQSEGERESYWFARPGVMSCGCGGLKQGPNTLLQRVRGTVHLMPLIWQHGSIAAGF